MKNFTQRRRLIRRAAVSSTAIGLTCTLVFGCSSDGPAPDAATSPDEGKTSTDSNSYAIQVYAGHPGSWKLIDIPVLANEAPTEGTGGPGGTPRSANAGVGLAPAATIDTPDGAVGFDQTDETTGSAWWLLYGAGVECGMGTAGTEPLSPFTPNTPLIPPWDPAADLGTPWFIFPNPPQYCDQLLAWEETLSCIAGKLSEIADSPAPIVWSRMGEVTLRAGIPAGPWTIPPQSAEDRFLARDMALGVLAHLALLDATIPTEAATAGTPWSTMTCSALYAAAAADPQTGYTTLYRSLFGWDVPLLYFPPAAPITESTVQANVSRRLEFEAIVLRQAGTALEELVGTSIEADLAGTERRRAKATDAFKGAQIAWGDSDGKNAYNTLGHVIRVLAGRLELGASAGHTDRRCANVAAMDTLHQSYGDDLAARITNRSPSTPGQSSAVGLVQSAGVIIPETVLATTPIASVRSAVRDQIVGKAAKPHDILPGTQSYADFVTSGLGAGLTKIVDDTSDGDLRFALDRSFERYQLLTGSNQAVSDVTTPAAGLTKAAFVADSLAGLSGTALEHGMPIGDLAVDFQARFGRMQKVSQCAMTTDEATVAALAGPQAFQDSFMLARTLERRLVVLRESASASGVAETETAESISNSGAAELRGWSGAGVIAAGLTAGEGGYVAPPSATGSSLEVTLAGFNARDLGLASLSTIGNQIQLVYSTPEIADCVAGLRASCPDNIDEYAVSSSASVIGWDGVSTGAKPPSMTGYDGVFLTLTFPSQGTHFAPVPEGDQQSDNHLYVVLRRDPDSGNGRGKVLGALALRESGKVSVSAVSDYRRKVLNDTTGIDRGWANKLGPDSPDPSFSPTYCIEGVPRGFYVPLENELTENSDNYENSWAHNLAMAAKTSAETDALGSKLIELGFQMEERRELANEQIAALCGDYPSEGEVKVDKGEVVMPTASDTLKNCLDEETIDVVYLTTVPSPAPSQGDLKALIGCKPTDISHACSEDVETAALNLAPFTAPPDPDAELCKTFASIHRSFASQGGFHAQEFEIALDKGKWLVNEVLTTVAGSLHLEVEGNGHWTVDATTGKIMDSAPDSGLWPGCMRTTRSVPCSQLDAALVMSHIFREGGTEAWHDNPDTPTYTNVSPPIEAAELPLLLWRVQGALWSLGAMTGRVPGGMFNVPIPAVNFNGLSDSTLALMPTVYGTSMFDGVHHLEDNSPPDNSLVIDATTPAPIDSAYAAFPDSEEIPRWLRVPYLDRERYLHLFASNNDLVTPGDIKALADRLTGGFKGVRCDTGSDVLKYAGSPAGTPDQSALDFTVLARAAVWPNDGIGARMSCSGIGYIHNITPFENGQVGTTFNDLIFRAYDDNYEADPELTKYCDGWGPPMTHEYHEGHVTSIRDLWSNQNDWPDGATQHPVIDGMHWIRKDAAAANWQGPVLGGWTQPTQNVMSAVAFPPAERVRAFVNAYPPVGPCGAGTRLTQVAALACLLIDGVAVPVFTDPPAVNSTADFPALSAWIGTQEKTLHQKLSALVLYDVPTSIVRDFEYETTQTQGLAGTRGELLVTAENNIREIRNSWSQIQAALAAMRYHIQAASLAAQAAGIRKDIELTQNTIATFQTLANMAAATAKAVEAAGGIVQPWNKIDAGKAASFVAIVGEISAYSKALYEMQTLRSKYDAQYSNQIDTILLDLGYQLQGSASELDKGFTTLLTATQSAALALEKLKQNQRSAAYQIAKASNASYYYDPATGEAVSLPVNTVLGRQYDTTRLRYLRVLKEAKYQAYIARLAIEQRIGMRLASIKQPIGPLDAPATWADDVCSLTGVDYTKYRTYQPPASNTTDAGYTMRLILEGKAVQDLSEQFIGDYVGKLERFVEYYNLEYPSHEGDDLAVLSLRDQLLNSSKPCFTESPNLLYFSGNLDHRDSVQSGEVQELRGWQSRPNDAGDVKALRISPAAALLDYPDPPSSIRYSGVTWLHEFARTPTGTGSGLDGPPSRSVYQDVELSKPGSYVLSWSDQARTSVGALVTGTGSGAPYRVAVYDDRWHLIPDAVFEDSPHVVPASGGQPDLKQLWARRTLAFKATAEGTVHVVFMASGAGSQLGSVAIADVQLEAGTEAQAYIGNGVSRKQVSPWCPDRTPEDVRNGFTRRCDEALGCYYDLNVPAVIDTKGLNDRTTSLLGHLAADNFNYRHLTVAVNLVGTAVHDCSDSSSSSCYSSGYVEYTLAHDAYSTPIVGYDGNTHLFNFGGASINHGKALAAERYITNPLGSADQTLLAEASIEKSEFRGRPLDGTYRLRIWDSPALHWDRLEDVQIILKYRYWSAVDREPDTH